jgi:eukaryotic-like serine/threonine-protein kinase
VARVAVIDALRAGTILFGKFRIERIVGSGSMGVVLEATDVPLDRKVAVKVLSPERSHSEEAKKRFLREARAAARLSSQHVTRLIDVGELDDGTPFLIMEFLVGSTLSSVVAREGLPAVYVAVDWAVQALDGIAEAHRLGLVHRDLKPENLFLFERPDRPPIVKVLDFGTVKDLVTKATKLTRSGATMGSPAYMAPEQVRGEEVDARADVWAMGVTLYELLTGSLPFGGDSVPQTLAAILRDEPVPVQRRRPDVPADLARVIACALSKDRAHRYASATELLEALTSVRSRLPKTTTTKTVRLPDAIPAPGSNPEAFADTTDMSAFTDKDVSQVRARRPTAATLPEGLPPPKPSRMKLLLAIIVAIILGGVGGVLFARHLMHGRQPAFLIWNR